MDSGRMEMGPGVDSSSAPSPTNKLSVVSSRPISPISRPVSPGSKRTNTGGLQPRGTGNGHNNGDHQIVYVNGIGFEASPMFVASALMSGAQFARPTEQQIDQVLSGTPNGVLLEGGPDPSDLQNQQDSARTIGASPTSGTAQTQQSSNGLRKRRPRKFRVFIDEHFNDSFEEHVGELVYDVNYDVTFRTFQIRMLERERTGTYRRSNFFKVFASVAILVLCGALLAFWGVMASVTTHLLGVIIIMVLGPLSIIFIWLISIRFRGLTMILVATVAAFFVISWIFRDPSSPDYARALAILLITFFLVFLTALIFYVSFYVIWPKLILNNLKQVQVSLEDTWKIKPAVGIDGKPNGFFDYQTYDGTWKRKTRHFSYRGEVNDLRQPHGMGEWFDDSFKGECVRGYFENGIPVGPFISREYGTSNQFAAVRLVIWRNVEDPWDHNWTWKNSRNKRGPQWGTVCGECSVGGSFFAIYPRAEQLIPPTFPADDPDIVRKCFENVALGLPKVPPGIKREVLVILHGMNSPLQYACGTYSQLLTLSKFPTHIIVPVMFSWPGGTLANYHGARRVAEDKAWRDDFKSFIRTLREQEGIEIFHIMSHSMGARVVINMCEVFPEIFEQVGEDGEHADFKTTNFMDTRYFKRSMSSIDPFAERAYVAHPEFIDPGSTLPRQARTSGTGDDPPRKPRLMTVTFLNGEGSIERFRQVFPTLRSVCPIITAYGDENDWALLFSEILNGNEKMLGRSLETLYVEPEDYQRMENYFAEQEENPMILDTEFDEEREDGTEEVLSEWDETVEGEQDHHAEFEEEEEEEHDFAQPPGSTVVAMEANTATELKDLRQPAPGKTKKSRLKKRKRMYSVTSDEPAVKAIARYATYVRRQSRRYYDMDVVSTEFLQTNVQKLRHVYFHFNRQFMDDLRESIVDKRRARYRRNLALRFGNVYGFLNVPPYVTV